jgi:hypothetical protein
MMMAMNTNNLCQFSSQEKGKNSLGTEVNQHRLWGISTRAWRRPHRLRGEARSSLRNQRSQGADLSRPVGSWEAHTRPRKLHGGQQTPNGWSPRSRRHWAAVTSSATPHGTRRWLGC